MRSVLVILLVIALPILSPAQGSLRHEHVVDDYAGLYTQEQANELASSIKAFWDTAQIALVTVKSLDGREIQEFATELFNRWGVGDKQKDNGLLFIIAPAEHKAWASTGNGIQGYITDLQAAKLQREYLVPEAKKGNYYAGTKATLNAYIERLRKSPEAHTFETSEDSYMWMAIPGMFLTGLVIFFMVLRRRRKRREAAEEEMLKKVQDANDSRRLAKLAYGGGTLGYATGYSSGGYVSRVDNTPVESYTAPSRDYDNSYTPPSSNNDSNTNDNSFSFGGGSNDGGGGGSEW